MVLFFISVYGNMDNEISNFQIDRTIVVDKRNHCESFFMNHNVLQELKRLNIPEQFLVERINCTNKFYTKIKQIRY